MTDQKQILTEVNNFYANFFSNKDSELKNQNLNNIKDLNDSTKLTDTESNALAGILTMQEIGDTLKEMKNKKVQELMASLQSFSKYFGEN